MTELKLGKLPDREAVKITFTASPDLKAALNDYAEIYQRSYGQQESVADLIPFMLAAFMEGDKAFLKARKGMGGGVGQHCFMGPGKRGERPV